MSIFALLLFPLKRNKASGKKPAQKFHLFIFIILHGRKTNSFCRFPVMFTAKSWSQMLFRKLQKGQRNMLSTSLKVKKVTSRLSDLVLRKLSKFVKFWSLFTSVARIRHQISTGFFAKLRFSAKYSFFGQSLSRGHYQPTYQPPEGVYLLITSLIGLGMGSG